MDIVGALRRHFPDPSMLVSAILHCPGSSSLLAQALALRQPPPAAPPRPSLPILSMLSAPRILCDHQGATDWTARRRFFAADATRVMTSTASSPPASLGQIKAPFSRSPLDYTAQLTRHRLSERTRGDGRVQAEG